MVKVYDDFLSESEFTPIKDFFLGFDITWRWCGNKSRTGVDDLDNYQFYHLILLGSLI